MWGKYSPKSNNKELRILKLFPIIVVWNPLMEKEKDINPLFLILERVKYQRDDISKEIKDNWKLKKEAGEKVMKI